jgi:hypothetical protein
MVVWKEPVLEYALVFHLYDERDMAKETLKVDVDTIQGWKAPC